MERQTKPVTDPRVLRVITHPIRLRLYEALIADGPATGARLSKTVPIAPGSLSYHLRQLAEYGYVEEAENQGSDSRERWWRAVPGGVRFSLADFSDSPGGREAVAAAVRVQTGRQLSRLQQWQNGGVERFGPEWAKASVSTDSLLSLTSDELRELSAEIDSVLEKWGKKSRAVREASAEDIGREHVFLFLHAFPFVGSGSGNVLDA
ncbi:winged helix-turn-helix domain-containing protein [Streptomyces sp. NPDC059443]|uniref:winged helix-turn-helix domain-containing protein n=1 Tax=unclassified Streptomyces TaxID=2593676 RepID=UPI0036C2C0BF